MCSANMRNRALFLNLNTIMSREKGNLLIMKDSRCNRQTLSQSRCSVQRRTMPWRTHPQNLSSWHHSIPQRVKSRPIMTQSKIWSSPGTVSNFLQKSRRLIDNMRWTIMQTLTMECTTRRTKRAMRFKRTVEWYLYTTTRPLRQALTNSSYKVS